VIDLGHGVTFSVVRQDARPIDSVSTVRTWEAHVVEWHGETAARLTVYTDIDAGRAAAERLTEERG
jgi:tagatose-1,6-bisphosphate aldolase